QETVRRALRALSILPHHRGLTSTVVNSLVRQNNRAVCLCLYGRCSSRTTTVDHITRIERRRLALIITRIPLAFVHIPVKLAVVDSEVVPIARLHPTHQVEVPSEGLALEVQYV